MPGCKKQWKAFWHLSAGFFCYSDEAFQSHHTKLPVRKVYIKPQWCNGVLKLQWSRNYTLLAILMFPSCVKAIKLVSPVKSAVSCSLQPQFFCLQIRPKALLDLFYFSDIDTCFHVRSHSHHFASNWSYNKWSILPFPHIMINKIFQNFQYSLFINCPSFPRNRAKQRPNGPRHRVL